MAEIGSTATCSRATMVQLCRSYFIWQTSMEEVAKGMIQVTPNYQVTEPLKITSSLKPDNLIINTRLVRRKGNRKKRNTIDITHTHT